MNVLVLGGTGAMGSHLVNLLAEENHMVTITSPWKYQVTYDRYYNRCFCNDKVNEFIDISSFKSPIIALQECLETFLKHPVFNEIHIKDQAQMDSIAREHTGVLEVKDMRKYWSYVRLRYLGRD